MSIYLPEDPDQPIEEPDYPVADQGSPSNDEEEKRGGRSQLDNLQDAKDLKDKMAGKPSGAEGAAGAGETAAEGAGGAGGGAATAGEGLGAAAGAGAGEATGVAAGAVGTGAAVGAEAAAEATALGAGVAGAPETLGLSLLPAAATAAASDRGRKIMGFGGCGCVLFGVALILGPLFLVMAHFAPKSVAPGISEESVNLTIAKTASTFTIAKGTANATVTYTITVTNHSTRPTGEVTVTDTFTSNPNTGFAGEIAGYDKTFTIPSIPAGQTAVKTFTVSIPHTDFDPGWVLTNIATSSGKLEGVDATETSSAITTVIIGNPPVVPPTGCPMIGSITTPYGANIPGYPLPTHDGVDLGDGVKNNAPVYATISGTLRYADYNSTHNGEHTERIIISNGVYQVEYFHLSPDGQAPEGQVTVGQKIGNEDETGYTQGEHLHYEVRVNGSRVNPTEFMSAVLNYTQPADNNFSGYVEPSSWGSCRTLPQGVAVAPPPVSSPVSEFFTFDNSGEKAWTQAEKDMVSATITTPVKSATWKSLVFASGKVTLKRSSVDSTCPDICSGFAQGTGTLILRDKFFSLTDKGRVFVLTHELTHLLQVRSSQVATDFNNSSALGEFQSKGVIRSYPLCSGTTCQEGLSAFNENFAEMAGNYVGDRDGYTVNFPNEYPEQFKFARDKMFGGTSF